MRILLNGFIATLRVNCVTPWKGKSSNPWLALAGLLATLQAAPLVFAADNEDSVMDRAREIHAQVMTIDTHVDIPFNFASEEMDPADAPDAQVDLQKMHEGGLNAVFFIVYVGQTERTEANYQKAKADAINKFDAIHRMTDSLYSDRIGLATTAEEARKLHAQGKLVALIGIENGYVIGKDISLLSDYFQRGARYMTLVHNGNNDIGDSAQPRGNLGDSMEDSGLSEFGFEVVDELNRLGILVDISHVSRKTMLEATRRSKAPVIASHSGVSSLADHPRNLNDEQLLALKENGGVVQIVAFNSYVTLLAPERSPAIRALREEFDIRNSAQVQGLSNQQQISYGQKLEMINSQWPGSTVSDFVDHIDYAVNLIGIDHVGISSDFDGGGGIEGWNSAAETFNVTLELVRRGYSQNDIAKIWGENLLRILQQAEDVATNYQ